MNIQSTVRRPVTTAKPKEGQNQQPQDPGESDPKTPSDFLTTSVELLKDGGMFILNESREAAKNDPALGLRLAGADAQWTFLLIGVLIIAAVAVDQWIRKVAA